MQSMETVPARKIEWRRAWKALRTLVADSQRTDQVFEITDALAGNSFERSFQRFRKHPDGHRLLEYAPSRSLKEGSAEIEEHYGRLGQSEIRERELACRIGIRSRQVYRTENSSPARRISDEAGG